MFKRLKRKHKTTSSLLKMVKNPEDYFFMGTVSKNGVFTIQVIPKKKYNVVFKEVSE